MPRAALATLGIVMAIIAVMGVTRSASSTVALHGDTDCNGAVEHPDIIPVLEHLADTSDSHGCDPAATDIDCDGHTDVTDALNLLFYFEGLPGPTPSPGCAGIGSPVATPLTPTPTPEGTTPPATETEPPLTETSTQTPEVTESPTATPPFCPQGVPTASPGAGTPPTTPIPTAYTLHLLMQCEHFIVPTDFAAIPGHPDEALISTQAGLVWRVSVSGQFEPTLAADLRDRVMRVSDEGLLSIAFQPGSDDYVFVNYNTGTAYNTDDETNPSFGDATSNRCDGVPGVDNPPDPKRSVVARFSYTDDKLVKDTEHVVIEVERPHCWHNIAQIAFDPNEEDIMYIASGDGGGTGSRYDDHTDPLINLLGVIMRIRILPSGDYDVPDDNPFIGQTSHPEIWAVEFRHPWRIAIDSIAGVWTGDVGQERWEEVDKVEAGGNYGWNKMEGTHCYPTPTPSPSITPTPSPTPFPPPCYTGDMTLPVSEYSHSVGCAIAVGYVYRGTAMPELDGHLLYGDYCSGRIWALDAEEASPTPIEMLNDQWAIVSFGRTSNGEIVVLATRTIGGVQTAAILQLVRN